MVSFCAFACPVVCFCTSIHWLVQKSAKYVERNSVRESMKAFCHWSRPCLSTTFWPIRTFMMLVDIFPHFPVILTITWNNILGQLLIFNWLHWLVQELKLVAATEFFSRLVLPDLYLMWVWVCVMKHPCYIIFYCCHEDACSSYYFVT